MKENTRFTNITDIKIGKDSSGYWRHWDCGNLMLPRAVGPVYRSKVELLADHEDYMRRAGWLGKEVDALQVVKNATIRFSMYHGMTVGRVEADGEESSLYSVSEIDNLLQLMRSGRLQGSFFIGKVLAPDATIRLTGD